MAELFDPRLTPARADIAAQSLRGKVNAERYVSPQVRQVHVPLTSLYRVPDANTQQQTELLLGEVFEVYEEKDGWAWGQAQRDNYVGYVANAALAALHTRPDTRVRALRTPIFTAPDLKSRIQGYAHGNSVFAGAEKQNGYLKIARQNEPDPGWVFAGHTVPLTEFVADWVSVAECFEGVPYVWGGRSSFGLDCSGLVQNALEAGGIAAPRDSDMQEKALGVAVEITETLSGLKAGDLVFWQGHVGIMLDPHILLHANAHHMAVVREPVIAAAARIKNAPEAPGSTMISSIRRL